MIEAKVPKDIRSYKTKVAGPLSFRQLICFGICVVVDVAIFFLIQQPHEYPMSSFLYIYIFIDCIIFSFTLEPSGMPMEVYLKNVMVKNFFYPTKRRVKTDFSTETEKVELTNAEKKKKAKELETKFRQHPEWRMYQ